ncbi:CYTH and CHAD domain-containing protein [Microtetraspora sp. NBRC 13810]|uniref:CYTH and CHAD domain-containing protein n=1 Tax=Microtetraspora sp. NBRC 13810 TaxID=3030990 RepID=UPI00255698C1|nr:CYTH and CHAD domain-containing protein [Microtetraspora sp. NBRC 13810]
MAIEIEDKFDVPVDYEIPDLTGVRGAAEVVGPRSHQLVAIYFDTADLRLAARGITLRRRRGGADAGWHLKLPKAKGVRQEITHPLTKSAKIVPPDLAQLVLAFTRGAALAPIAELDTRRSVTLLRGPDGRTLLEVADDRVKGTVFGAEPHVERWREVEAELIAADDDALLRKVGKRLRKAGAVPADSASKLSRLLNGAAPAPVPAPAPTSPGSAGEVVVGYLRTQVNALLAQDPRVRRAEEDAVHQMRVASRRLRSALKAFKSVVPDTRPLQDELKWLGNELGEVRDLEVIRARFGKLLGGLPDELVVGPVAHRLGSDLEAKESQAYDRVRVSLGGERYFGLLNSLEALVAAPPLTERAGRPAAKTLTAVAAKQWHRVTGAYDTAQAIEDQDERDIAMHEVRKAAKRARYTAEALGMTELARRAEDVQETLGVHQDGVIAQELLEREAETARRAGEDAFTYGVLVGLERAAADRAYARFPKVWKKTTAAVHGILG